MVTNGCSFTYGADLRDRAVSCWGRVVADELGARFVNLAAGGGSNRRLVRTTVEQLEDVADRAGVSHAETLFIGMWTELPRWEVYDPAEPEYSALSDAFQDRPWHRIGIWSLSRGYRPARSYYRFLQHDEGDFLDFLLGYVLLEQFLRVKGFAYIFTLVQAYPGLVTPDPQYASFLRNIDEGRLLGGFTSCWELSFIELIRKHGLPMSGRKRGSIRGNGHPLEEAHLRYAREWLLPFIRATIPGAASAR